MSSVKQLIPSFVQGMSDQPDELKIPGQLRSVTNALPDVTLGLIKRPGLKHLAELSGSDYEGKWFNIFAENNKGFEEQYICNISLDGVVSIWAAVDIENIFGNVVVKAGEPINTSQPAAQPLLIQDGNFIKSQGSPRVTTAIDYFKHNQKAQLQELNIGATTLVTNRQITPTMSGDAIDIEKNPYEGFIELKQVAFGRDYTIDVMGSGGTDVKVPSASAISISPGSFKRNENRCQGQGIDNLNFDDDNGPGTGLRFQIRAACFISPSDSNDSPGDSNYQVSVNLQNGGKDWRVGDSVSFTYKTYGYTVTVTAVSLRTVANSLGSVTYTTPTDGSGGALAATDILAGLKADLEALTYSKNGTNTKVFTEVKIIGNGIYLKSDRDFTIGTPEDDLFNLLSTTTEVDEDKNPTSRYLQVNNVGLLPEQAADGLIVKVVNTFNDQDDYYVKFLGNENMDGPGVWEETYKPGIKTAFNGSTMPHVIRRTVDSDGNLVFEVSEVDWINRTVGDDRTNPVPSFVGDSESAPTVNNMILYRNRLVFLSSNNVILSQSGDLGNWFGDTALTIKSSDPIDINASVDTSTALYDGLVVNNGMVLFSKFNQFLFTTDSDILSPQTAKSSLLGTYDFNPNSNPFNMASNIGFWSSAGNDSIFWEMRDIFREGPPNVEERSKPVQRSLPSDLDLCVASREDGLILTSTRYSNEVWGYRYYTQGDKQIQSAWFRWTIPGEMLFHFNNTRGKYWVVYRDTAGKVQLTQLDLKDKLRAFSLEGVPYEYYVYQDSWFEVKKPAYDSATKRTAITPPYTPDKDLYAYSLTDGQYRGRSVKVEYDGTDYYLPGNWSDSDLAIGYQFEMEAQFPHLYVTQREGTAVRSDTTGSLTLHRLKVNFSTVGMFTFELNRYGKDPYTMTTETTVMDGYDADRVAGYPHRQFVIPVYDRSDNALPTMKSSHPTPATLLSLTFEGDYTTNYYKSV